MESEQWCPASACHEIISEIIAEHRRQRASGEVNNEFLCIFNLITFESEAAAMGRTDPEIDSLYPLCSSPGLVVAIARFSHASRHVCGKRAATTAAVNKI
jgi:hypothetical protein